MEEISNNKRAQIIIVSDNVGITIRRYISYCLKNNISFEMFDEGLIIEGKELVFRESERPFLIIDDAVSFDPHMEINNYTRLIHEYSKRPLKAIDIPKTNKRLIKTNNQMVNSTLKRNNLNRQKNYRVSNN